MATTLARALHVNGIMDVELVFGEGHLKVLEIDARLPSQTPTVVERSMGSTCWSFSVQSLWNPDYRSFQIAVAAMITCVVHGGGL